MCDGGRKNNRQKHKAVMYFCLYEFLSLYPPEQRLLVVTLELYAMQMLLLK